MPWFNVWSILPLLQLLSLRSGASAQDVSFEITKTTDSTPIPVVCPHKEAALQCAKRVCSDHNLMDTVEGMGCVEMLGDEIRSRRGAAGADLPSVVANDYEDARFVRLYQDHRNNDISFTRFCSLNRIDMGACQG